MRQATSVALSALIVSAAYVSAPAQGQVATTAYVGVRPCRVADTRLAGGPLAGGETRQFRVLTDGNPLDFQGGNPNGCGIPFDAVVVLLNFVAVDPDGFGHLTAFGAAEQQPLAAVLSYGPGTTIANAVPINVAPADCPAVVGEPCGEFNVVAGVSGTDIVIDVYGYFID